MIFHFLSTDSGVSIVHHLSPTSVKLRSWPLSRTWTIADFTTLHDLDRFGWSEEVLGQERYKRNDSGSWTQTVCSESSVMCTYLKVSCLQCKFIFRLVLFVCFPTCRVVLFPSSSVVRTFIWRLTFIFGTPFQSLLDPILFGGRNFQSFFQRRRSLTDWSTEIVNVRWSMSSEWVK